MNHIQLQQLMWRAVVKSTDIVIDATCGNGHDTLFLTTLNPKRVIALDTQQEAIESAKQRVEGVEFYHQCHSSFPPSIEENSVGLIVYNLGYLPGSNKEIITKKETTLESVKKGLKLLRPGGLLSLTIYTGHPGGKEEEETLLEFAKSLPSQHYRVQHTTWKNYRNHPSNLSIFSI